MKKLKRMLDVWYEGRKFRGVETPPPEVIDELYAIYKKEQRETISVEVIEILKKCRIAIERDGIGWKILG